jgi:hypothetical protein
LLLNKSLICSETTHVKSGFPLGSRVNDAFSLYLAGNFTDECLVGQKREMLTRLAAAYTVQPLLG